MAGEFCGRIILADLLAQGQQGEDARELLYVKQRFIRLKPPVASTEFHIRFIGARLAGQTEQGGVADLEIQPDIVQADVGTVVQLSIFFREWVVVE